MHLAQSAAARLQGLRVRILPEAFICLLCCQVEMSLVLSGRGLCDGSISRPDEFYRLCVTGCDKVQQ